MSPLCSNFFNKKFLVDFLMIKPDQELVFIMINQFRRKQVFLAGGGFHGEAYYHQRQKHTASSLLTFKHWSLGEKFGIMMWWLWLWIFV